MTCTSRDGTSQIGTSTPAAEAKIELGAEDLVICTYTDEYAPPPQGLDDRKMTEGGVGTFGFSVDPAGGGASPGHRHHRARRRGGGRRSSPLDLDPGRYRIAEELPRPAPRAGSSSGSNAAAKRCRSRRAGRGDGERPRGRKLHLHQPVRAARQHHITKITRGGTGTTGFEVESSANPEESFLSRATTTADGSRLRPRRVDRPSLELGRYAITESARPGQGRMGTGRSALRRQGGAVRRRPGRSRPDRRGPRLNCEFVNRFHAVEEPPLPPAQRPRSGGRRADGDQATRHPPGSRRVIEYEVTVKNEGRGDGGAASMVDQPLGPARFVFARPNQGSCGEAMPVICDLGTLPAGEAANVRVAIVLPPGLLINRAVAGTSSDEQQIAGADGRDVGRTCCGRRGSANLRSRASGENRPPVVAPATTGARPLSRAPRPCPRATSRRGGRLRARDGGRSAGGWRSGR